MFAPDEAALFSRGVYSGQLRYVCHSNPNGLHYTLVRMGLREIASTRFRHSDSVE